MPKYRLPLPNMKMPSPTRLENNNDNPQSVLIETSRGIFAVDVYAGPDSAPLLHFAHANGFSGCTYRSFLRPLTKHFRVIAIDFRGFGKSLAEATPENFNRWDQHGDDLAAVLAHFGEPAHLVGHSMGAVVSCRLAARQPGIALSLFLIDPVIFGPMVSASSWILRQLKRSDLVPITKSALNRRAFFDDLDQARNTYRGRGVFKKWPDEMLEDYLQSCFRLRVDGKVELSCTPRWEARNFATMAVDTIPKFRTLKMPTKILAAEVNSTFAPSAERMIKWLNPAIVIERLPGTPHMMPMTDTQVVLRHLSDHAREQ